MIIYITENLINGKKYIGKDTQNKKSYLGSGKLLKKAIKKYGIKNFKKTTLEFCKDTLELSNREKYWIDFFDAVNNKNYYNLVHGGDGGDTFSKLSDEQKINNILVKSNNGKNRIGNSLKEEFFKKRGDVAEKEWESYQLRRAEAQKKSFIKRIKKADELYGDKIKSLYKTHGIEEVYKKLNGLISKKTIKLIIKNSGVEIKQKSGINSGEKNGMSKLSKIQVEEIRKKYENKNYTYKKLSQEYSMSIGQIGKLIRKETYN